MFATNRAAVKAKLIPTNRLEGQNDAIKYSQRERKEAVEYMET